MSYYPQNKTHACSAFQSGPTHLPCFTCRHVPKTHRAALPPHEVTFHPSVPQQMLESCLCLEQVLSLFTISELATLVRLKENATSFESLPSGSLKQPGLSGAQSLHTRRRLSWALAAWRCSRTLRMARGRVSCSQPLAAKGKHLGRDEPSIGWCF